MTHEMPSQLERLNWPETMWPLSPQILDSYPDYLIPDEKELARITYPWELLALLQKKLDEQITDSYIDPEAKVATSTIIDGHVHIAAGVKVYPGAVLTGPIYIGQDAIIAAGSRLMHSYVGPNAIYNGELSKSNIGAGSEAHGGLVLDSLFDDRVSFSQSTTANTRFDGGEIPTHVSGEKIFTGRRSLGAIIGNNTKFGAGCRLNSGVMVGRNCEIGLGTILTRNVPNNSRVMVEQQHTITQI